MIYRALSFRARDLPRLLLAALAVTAGTACGDRRDVQAAADSALARDLALANVVASPPELPEFNDAPLGEAPQPERVMPDAPPARVSAPRASDPPPRPRPAPRREAPRPQPAPRAAEAVAVAVADRDPQPAPGPASAAAGFAAGTRLALNTDARVCTVTGRPGDKLTATLRDPVRGTGGAIIPAGSMIVLEVASVEPGEPAEAGAITFRVRSLDVNSTAYPSRGSAQVRGGLQRSQAQGAGASSDGRKVATGAVAGAILGRVLGGDTRGAVIGAAAGGAAGAVSASRNQQFEGCLPAGSPVTVVLEQGLTVS